VQNKSSMQARQLAMHYKKHWMGKFVLSIHLYTAILFHKCVY